MQESTMYDYVVVYKCPRIVETVASLPVTATGKILKRELT
jgi:acyl-CoA synthetase (AMP-forming)/AMP-acid ligase II